MKINDTGPVTSPDPLAVLTHLCDRLRANLDEMASLTARLAVATECQDHQRDTQQVGVRLDAVGAQLSVLCLLYTGELMPASDLPRVPQPRTALDDEGTSA